jgi:hypothetical protein
MPSPREIALTAGKAGLQADAIGSLRHDRQRRKAERSGALSCF